MSSECFILSKVEHAANTLCGANRDGVFASAGHMCVGVNSAVQDGLLPLEQTAASNVSQTHFFLICLVAPFDLACMPEGEIHTLFMVCSISTNYHSTRQY